jgi:RNA polymerase sigma-70 factor (ECF subfamily)
LQHETTDLAGLIARVAERDRSAFGELYDRTAAKLLGVALRILRDRGRAEDVLQEVYLRVWQNASSYSPEAGRPMTWLITIARNRAIDVARQRPEPLAGQDGEDETDWLASVPDPRDREAEFTEADGLRRCLEKLDEVQRSCVLGA